MKFLMLISFSFLLMTSCQSQEKQKPQTASNESRIEVIDFHTTHRCKTCLKIESQTEQLLKAAYKEELDKGLIVFKIVNIDETENYAMAEHFEAASTALFINVVRNGKEEHIDLTDFAFMKAFDEAAFQAGLKENLDQQLKTL